MSIQGLPAYAVDPIPSLFSIKGTAPTPPTYQTFTMTGPIKPVPKISKPLPKYVARPVTGGPLPLPKPEVITGGEALKRQMAKKPVTSGNRPSRTRITHEVKQQGIVGIPINIKGMQEDQYIEGFSNNALLLGGVALAVALMMSE